MVALALDPMNRKHGQFLLQSCLKIIIHFFRDIQHLQHFEVLQLLRLILSNNHLLNQI